MVTSAQRIQRSAANCKTFRWHWNLKLILLVSEILIKTTCWTRLWLVDRCWVCQTCTIPVSTEIIAEFDSRAIAWRLCNFNKLCFDFQTFNFGALVQQICELRDVPWIQSRVKYVGYNLNDSTTYAVRNMQLNYVQTTVKLWRLFLFQRFIIVMRTVKSEQSIHR